LSITLSQKEQDEMKILMELDKKYNKSDPAKFYLNQYAQEKYGKIKSHKMTIELEKVLFEKETGIDLNKFLEKKMRVKN